MEILNFDSGLSFAEYISHKYYDLVETSSDDFTLGIIAKYDFAKELISDLCYYGFGIESVNISDVEYCGYDKEWLIELNDGNINCERAISPQTHNYVVGCSTVGFILGDCSHAATKCFGSDTNYEVDIEDSVEEVQSEPSYSVKITISDASDLDDIADKILEVDDLIDAAVENMARRAIIRSMFDPFF